MQLCNILITRDEKKNYINHRGFVVFGLFNCYIKIV